MTQPSDQLLDKIRAMLRLATNDGATEHERDAAMAKANQLLLRHNLDRDQLLKEGAEHAAGDDMLEGFVPIEFEMVDAMIPLFQAITRANLCRILINFRGIRIFGRRSNVEASVEFLNWIQTQLEPVAAKSLRDYFQPAQQGGWAFNMTTGEAEAKPWKPLGSEDETSYLDGFYRAAGRHISQRLLVAKRVFEEDPDGKALVLRADNEAEQWMKALYPGTKTHRSRVLGRDGATHGRTAGEGVTLGRATGIGSATALQLGAGA